VDLELTRDQLDLATLARDLFTRRGDLAPARAFLEGEGDAGPMLAEVAELGWYAVGLAQDDPFGVPGLCLLAEAVGAHLAPSLLVESAVCATLCARAVQQGDENELVARVAAGELAVALGVLEVDRGWSLADIATSAGRSAPTMLNGRKLGVRHARRADVFAVTAMVGVDVGLALVEPEHAEALDTRRGLDPTAGACDVEFLDAPVAAVIACDRGDLEDAWALGAVATTAEALGAASRALTMAVEYSLDRQQYGRPIGSNQALQHLMAELHILVETTRSAVLYTAGAIEEGLDDAGYAAAVTKAYGSRSTRRIVEGALQVFGGIGFTWEHDSHLLQRRVLECERRFGDAIDHERRITQILTEEPAHT
jgi:alkylation response protein AidB-like acyl-CoA dehydrogenase